MKIDEEGFHALLLELAEENPLACRGLLGMAGVEFTSEVPTAAVTLGARPVLQVNLSFIGTHCSRESHVKALLIHELLHVLLRHTLEIRHMTRAVNIALDAVINAIIHRKLGEDYSEFMSHFYVNGKGPMALLRRQDKRDLAHHQAALGKVGEKGFSPDPEHLETLRWLGREGVELWSALYAGRALHEDVLEFLKSRTIDAWRERPGELEPVFLGNHGSDGNLDPDDLPPDLAARLRAAAREIAAQGLLPGQGITKPGDLSVPPAASPEIRAWERLTVEILRKLVTPDRRGGVREAVPALTRLPVLHAGDRRGVLRSLWNPLITENPWTTYRMQPRGTVAVYLDVSGSMSQDLQAVTALLHRFERHLRRPFYAFANTVEPAEFQKGRLVTKSTGGTSLACVLEHLRRTRPEKALVITDGFVEQLPPWAYALAGVKVEVLLTAKGTLDVLRPSGWPISRLPAHG